MRDRWLARHVRLAPSFFIASVTFALVAGVAAIGQAWFLSSAIEGVFLRGQTLAAVIPLLAALALAAVVRFGSTMAGEIASSELALSVKSNLRDRLLAHLFELGPAFTVGERTGELTAAAVEGVESLDAYFSQYLPQLITAALVPLVVLLVVLPVDIISAAVLLLTAPLIPLFIVLIGNAAEGLSRQQFNLLAVLSAHFLDTLQGLATLKLLNRSRAQGAGVRDASEKYAAATLAVLRVAFLSAFVLEIVATISTAIVAVEIGLRLLYGRMEIQPALFVLILAPEFYLPLRMLGQRFHASTTGLSAAKRIAEIFAIEPGLSGLAGKSKPSGASTEEFDGSPVGLISFKRVDYSYGNRPALRDVSFEVRRGETVALFGPTGSGKSTVFNLLLRFISPAAGEISIDTTPLARIPAAEWRRRLAWVPQRPHLLHESILENIRLARPDATLEEVERAARDAQLEEFIRSLPHGYETVVGEQGARLSGGEAQRVAIARAFLRDAPILLLDEPTSNVDPETEALLQQATERLLAGRTVIVIAHRLATIYRSDRVLVLDSGQVVQSGKHSDLLTVDGLYRRLALSADEGIG